MQNSNRTEDFQNRKKAIKELSESYIVEAAAGTGKTTILVERISNIIKKKKASIKEIVAITFTEKAATELKAKLRKKLEEDTSKLSEPDEVDIIYRNIAELDIAPIGTIHSFCASLIRECPVETGVNPNFEVADEFVASFIREKVWYEWWEKVAKENDSFILRILTETKLKDIKELADKLINNREILDSLSTDEMMKEPGNIDLRLFVSRLKGYIDAYQKAKRDENYLDFHDLLIIARNLLRDNPDVRKYFRKKFKYILVDEFQDTDPLQMEIVFFLSATGDENINQWNNVKIQNGRLFIVGDPKQSIYRFRRADIEMYEEAKGKMDPEKILKISKNFRCCPQIVEAVNEIFQKLIQKSDKPEEKYYQPEYIPLECGREKTTIPANSGIKLLCPPDGIINMLKDQQDCYLWEAKFIAFFIYKIVKEKNDKWVIWDDHEKCFRKVEYKDIAILVRKYSQVKLLEQAFDSLQINYRVIGGKSFYDRKEVRYLISVLMAIKNPYDQLSVVSALRSPFFGISDEELFLYRSSGGVFNYLNNADGTALEKPFESLLQLHRMRNVIGVPELLDKLYEMTGGFSLFLLEPQGQQMVANLMKISDMARAFERKGIICFDRFVNWLCMQMDVEIEEDAPTVEREDNYVRIMSIYKAKGLEFPVVIMAFLNSKTKEQENVIFNRMENKVEIKLGKYRTLNYDNYHEREKKIKNAEAIRVMYVGMTRARDFLILPGGWVKKKDGTPKTQNGSSFYDYLNEPVNDLNADRIELDIASLNDEFDRISHSRLNMSMEKLNKKASNDMILRRKRWEEELKQKIEIGSKSQIQFKSPTDFKLSNEALEWKKFEGGGESEGMILGRLVHKILEKVDWKNPDLVEKYAKLEGNFSIVTKAVELVKKAINSDILKRVVGLDNYQKEVPFSLFENGTIVEGVIDVVFKDNDKIGIIDFKTDMIDSEKELKERVKYYLPQMKIYSKAVEVIFGMPPHEVILFFLYPMKVITLTQSELKG